MSRRTIMAKNQLNLANVQIGFRNFEGREGTYNDKGDRSFVIFLDNKTATDLEMDGWNIKWPKARPDISDEEDSRQPFLKVSVSFDYYPAKVYLIKETGAEEPNIEQMSEVSVKSLDWAELSNVDLVIRPYEWTVSGKSGTKAYLKAGYFTLIEDEFGRKYGV